jgi:hypothetical protein
MRAKYQDNLENMQWFKSFFERNYAGQPYDPILRRAKGKGANSMPAFALEASKRGAPSLQEGQEMQPPGASAPGSATRTGSRAVRTSMGTSDVGNRGGGGGGGGGKVGISLAGSPVGAVSSSVSGGATVAALSSQLSASQSQVGSLTATVADLKISVRWRCSFKPPSLGLPCRRLSPPLALQATLPFPLTSNARTIITHPLSPSYFIFFFTGGVIGEGARFLFREAPRC